MVNLSKNQSGQALLIILLSMAVVLTLVLSVLSRTISDVNVSSESEDSQRAFSAAEAGIEQVLVVGSNTGTVDIGDTGTKFEATVLEFAEGNQAFVFPSTFVSGEPVLVWFVSHDSNGNLSCSGASNPCFTGDRIRVCWGDGTSPVPALETSIVYLNTTGDYSTARVARAAFDASAAARSNNFASPDGSCTIGSTTFQYSKTMLLNSFSPSVPHAANNLQFMVLKLLYSNTPQHIGVSVAGSGDTLPSQGQLVESSGTSGDANRTINVYQGYGELPFAFYSAIFSQGGLTQ